MRNGHHGIDLRLIRSGDVDPADPDEPTDSGSKDDSMLYYGIAMVVILLIILCALVMLRRKN